MFFSNISPKVQCDRKRERKSRNLRPEKAVFFEKPASPICALIFAIHAAPLHFVHFEHVNAQIHRLKIINLKLFLDFKKNSFLPLKK